MDGLRPAGNKQVPLDSRYSVDDILGSVTDIRAAGGYAAVDGPCPVRQRRACSACCSSSAMAI